MTFQFVANLKCLHMKQVFLTILMFAFSSVAYADDSGQCGDNLTYTFVEATKTLTISGTGNMTDYTFKADAPWQAFASNVHHVVLKSGLTSIGDYAFENLSELVAVDIPEGVTKIGRHAFDNCSNLFSAKLPQSLLSIGEYAFWSCESLIEVSIPSDVESIGSCAFSYCMRITKVVIPSKVKTIEDKTFSCCDALETVILPQGLKSIGKYAFDSCDRLTSITIPNGVTSIGQCAFANCFALMTVTIPNSVTSMDSWAFYNCTELTSFMLSNQLTSIETLSFHNDRKLKSITIPASVQKIDVDAFTDCKGMKELRVQNTTPPTMVEGAFSNYDLVLKVPASAITAYSNTEPWNKFKSIEVLNDEDLVFKKCAMPTITYTKDGELVFSCETEGVDFLYNFSSSGSSLGNKAVLTDNLIVTVYAIKSGYANSEPVTAEFTPKGRLGDLNGDGKVNVADHVKLSSLIMNP
jgi:hypothetical protein